MLKEKLRKWNYYYDKIPLYLKNSYGITDQLREVFYNLMDRVCGVGEEISEIINILNPSYPDLIKKYDTSVTQDKFEFLDWIAKLYGVSRDLSLEYTEIVEGTPTKQYVDVHLTNSELLKLIKARILQNNFNGTYEELRRYYDEMNLPILIFTSPDHDLEAKLVLNSQQLNNLTQNELYMIYAGLFNIKSMGIYYESYPLDTSKLAKWDDEDRVWDDLSTSRWI